MSAMAKPPFSSGPPPKPLLHWIQILLVLPVLVAFGHQAYRQYKTGGRKWTVDLIVALAGALVAAFALLQEAWLGGYLAKIVAVLGIYLTQLLAVCVVIGLGWTAHWFKQRNQLYYGYLEIVFGSFSAIAIVQRPEEKRVNDQRVCGPRKEPQDSTQSLPYSKAKTNSIMARRSRVELP
jgi:hypothetical protein